MKKIHSDPFLFTPPPQPVSQARSLALVPPVQVEPEAAPATRRLWLCVHLPRLPVDALTGAQAPFVATEEHQGRVQVATCSPVAFRRGVRPGMTLAAAQSLCRDLDHRPRDAALECGLLNRIAAAAYGLSATVAFQGSDGVLLEIGASLKLFGGFGEFLKRARRELEQCGACFVFGVAPTARAAAWCARHCPGRYTLFPDELPAVLRQLPITALTEDPKLLQQFERSGIRSVGAFMRLSREGAARRFGREVVQVLDEALGRRPESFPLFVPPQPFCAGEEFTLPADGWERLRFPAERLLARLEQYLLRRQAATREVHCLLRHERMPATVIRLGTSRHERRAAHFLDLLEKQFERLALPAPATALAVQCEHMEVLPPENLQLLSGRTQASQQWSTLVDQLRARLGDESLRQPRPAADHRPESGARVGSGVRVEIPGQASRRRAGSALISNPTLTPVPRPLWLLPKPAPLTQQGDTPAWRGPLSLSHLPERIEQGWWDGFDVCRDYYLARNPHGSRLWIFRDRRTSSWHLHGIFS